MNLLHANDRPGEYPPSYYAATRAEFAPCPALQGEVRKAVSRLETEKQFNRKVEINATLRQLKTELEKLSR